MRQVMMLMGWRHGATANGQQESDYQQSHQIAVQHGETIGQPEYGVAELIVFCVDSMKTKPVFY